MYVLCKPGDCVNVRQQPSTKATRDGWLECGDRVTTDGKTKKDSNGRKWTHITSPQFESGDSWVCSMYLQETPVEISSGTGYVISNGRTAIRRSPGGERIKWLQNGAEVSIVALSREWVLTTNGYIRRECLDISYD